MDVGTVVGQMGVGTVGVTLSEASWKVTRLIIDTDAYTERRHQ